MNSKTKNILIIASPIVVAVGIIMSFKADTVSNHVAALEHVIPLYHAVPQPPLKRAWSILMVRFVYPQTPGPKDAKFFADWEKAYEFHLDALTRLKHLERREFVQPDWVEANWDRNDAFRKRVYSTMLEVLKEDPVSKKLGAFNYESALPGMVVWAPPSAMPRFEKAIDELAANGMPEIP
ncbi:MAG: hypothetical protein ACPGVU_02575 [Limisphaerales bacterium]